MISRYVQGVEESEASLSTLEDALPRDSVGCYKAPSIGVLDSQALMIMVVQHSGCSSARLDPGTCLLLLQPEPVRQFSCHCTPEESATESKERDSEQMRVVIQEQQRKDKSKSSSQ